MRSERRRKAVSGGPGGPARDVRDIARPAAEPGDEASAMRLVNTIIDDAARHGASSIHLEPHAGGLIVRSRIGRGLAEMLRVSPPAAPSMVSRIKGMAGLEAAERHVPQEGRIAGPLDGRDLDLMVSTLPCHGGERLLLQLLPKDEGVADLAALGMPAAISTLYREALS